LPELRVLVSDIYRYLLPHTGSIAYKRFCTDLFVST
jgi:hypothetical protein